MQSEKYSNLKDTIKYFDGRDKLLTAISIAALSALFGASIGARKRKIVSALSIFILIVSSMPVIGKLTEAILDDDEIYHF